MPIQKIEKNLKEIESKYGIKYVKVIEIKELENYEIKIYEKEDYECI